MKCMKIEVFYCKRVCTCNQCDSLHLTALIKIEMMCSTMLLCLFTSKYDPNGSRLIYVPCPATILCIFICKSSARTKQSVIIVILKTCLLGISIYIKHHFCIDPTTILFSHQAVPPPHFTTKCRPCLWRSVWLISCVIKHTVHILILV